MTDDDIRNPVEQLAEEFMRRRRRGEAVAIEDYARAHPKLASKIFTLFPTLELLEKARSESGNSLLLDNDTRPGQRLGDYELLREIARGGMGIVYEAMQVSLDRRVAVKVLSPGLQKNQKYLERFQREARAAANLHHANIVPVFGAACESRHHFYVMQYIHGRGLDDVFNALTRAESGLDPDAAASDPAHALASALTTGRFRSRELDSEDYQNESRPLTVSVDSRLHETQANVRTPKPETQSRSATGQPGYLRRIAELGRDAADALAYAHRNGVLHRDIKPGNLVLDIYGHIWITDFGLAKFDGEEGLTETGDILGTLRYIAPESLRGKFDARSDIYGLGLTLHEMLGRERAFSAVSRGELARLISEKGPQLLSQAPRDLRTIVQKSVALDPADRYQDAAELAADLNRFLTGQPIRARDVSAAEKLWRWSRRNRALAMALTISFVLLLGGLIGSIAFSWRLNTLAAQRKHALAVAESEKRDANTRLVESNIARAEAMSRANVPGQRTEGLAAIRDAVPLARELGLGSQTIDRLRNAAIACLARADIQLSHSRKVESGSRYSVAFDPTLRYYAVQVRPNDTIQIFRTEDDALIETLPQNPYVLDHKWLSAEARHMAAVRDFEFAKGGFPLEIVEVLTGRVLHELGHIRQPGAFKFHADGELALASTTDGWVRVYRVGEPEAIFSLPAQSDCVAFAGPNQIAVCRKQTHRPFHWIELVYAACHPNELQGVLSRLEEFLYEDRVGSTLEIYALDTGDLVSASMLPGPASSIDAGPDGMLALVCTAPKLRSSMYSVMDPTIEGRTRRVLVFDGSGSKPILEMEHEVQGGLQVAMDESGRVLLVASQSQMLLFDARTGRKLLNVPGTFVGMSGPFIAIQQTEMLGTYQLTLPDVHRGLAAKYTPQRLAVDPLNQIMICADGNEGLRVLDLATGALLHQRADGHYTAAAITPDSKWLLTITRGPHQLKKWPIVREPGEIRFGPPEVIEITDGFAPHQMAIDPTGEMVVLDDPSRDQIAIWNLNGNDAANVIQGPDLMFVAISNNRRWAATGTWFGVESAIYDLQENKLAKRIFTGTSDVHFSADSKALICGRGKVVDLETWQSRQIQCDEGLVNFLHGFESPSSASMAFVATGSPDSALHIVDTITWSTLATLRCGEQTATSLRGTSTDGRFVVVTTFDANVHRLDLWDIALLRQRLRELDLDWEMPEFSAPKDASESMPTQPQVVFESP